jgi:hypothetical protein
MAVSDTAHSPFAIRRIALLRDRSSPGVTFDVTTVTAASTSIERGKCRNQVVVAVRRETSMDR